MGTDADREENALKEYPRAEHRMMPAQLSKALDDLGLTMREFCRVTGTGTKTVERWLTDEKDIPQWVPVTLALLTLPGALQIARTVAQHFNKEGSHDR